MMRFCQSCNNLLYPRENRVEKRLEYACRPPCTYVERDVTDACVFRNEIVKDSSTRLDVILSDMNKDPTLQRTTDIECQVCGNHEAVTFTAELHAKSTALNLVYVCCECGAKWMDTHGN